MGGDIYLADTSVYVLRGRDERVRARFSELVMQGRLAACQMSMLETLNTAPGPKQYEVLWTAFHAGRWMDTTTHAMDRALGVHRELAKKSQHRHFSLPDLIIAATAEQHGATVLHYDSDYDRIAKITDQPTEWVVQQGSI